VTDGGSEPLRALSWIIHQPKPARAGYLSRGGAFRALVWPFIYKAYAVGDFAEFLETFGLPFVVGKYGREASEDDKARLLAAVAALAHDARAIMPQEMQLEIQRVASSGNDSPHLAMVRWADEAIARTLKGQTLSGQAQSTGLGSGVANLHAQVRQDLRDADARQIAATLSRDLLWPMAMLNYGLTDPRRRPRLRFDVSATEDITAYAQAIPQLASAGVPIPVDWVRDRLGIPAPAAGAAVVAMGAPPVAATQKVAVATPDVAPGCGCAACAAGDYAGPEDDPTPVSLMTAQLDVEAANTGGAILDRVMRLVDEADSLTSLRDALLGAYGDRDTRQLSDIMALAFAAAHLAGRYDVENDHG
ncbi:MAG: DUF935 family protein, partial [Halothiobacillaceae bacterium]|nr:DUF935 family protein [Halothiobacillaceae bacterium]